MVRVTDNEGLRLDSYLANELNLSRSKVQKLIKDGKVEYSYSFNSSIYQRDITGEECNLVRKQLLDRLL